MFRLLALLSFLVLSACDPSIQTTSGRAFLAAHPIADPDITAAAAIEPDLRFPARIGLVRLVHNQITPLPEAERALLLQDMPKGLGTVVTLTSLDARLERANRFPNEKKLRSLAAARHLDYLLIISLDPGANTSEALFLGVANGYPYASISDTAPGRGKRNFWGGPLRNTRRLGTATMRLTTSLQPKLRDAAQRLLAESQR